MKRLSTLLVDDDGYARDLLGSILRELGCTVEHAVSSGEEAIRKCGKTRVDVMFLDIEMPGMNGFDTLQKMLTERPGQYVVMISAHSTLDNVKKAMELGARGFIVKPYTGAKVRDVLEKYRRDCIQPHTEPTLAAADRTHNDERSRSDDLDLESEPERAVDNPA